MFASYITYRRPKLRVTNTVTCRKYCCDIFPSSITKIIKKNSAASEDNLKSEKVETIPKNASKEFRVNEFNIQMISKNIYEQLFKKPSPPLDSKIVAR